MLALFQDDYSKLLRDYEDIMRLLMKIAFSVVMVYRQFFATTLNDKCCDCR